MRTIVVLFVAVIAACGGDDDESYDWSDPTVEPEGWENPYYSLDCDDDSGEASEAWSHWDLNIRDNHEPTCVREEDGFGGTVQYCYNLDDPRPDAYQRACDGPEVREGAPCLWAVLMEKTDGQCAYHVACVPESRWIDYDGEGHDWDEAYEHQC